MINLIEKYIKLKKGKKLLIVLSSIVALMIIILNIKIIIKERNKNYSVIYEKVSRICELATIKYNYSDVIVVKNNKNFKGINIPLTQKSFLIKYDGCVKVGVNLKDTNIKYNKNRNEVNITLSKSNILNHSINEESILVYDEKSSIFNKLTFKDMIDEIDNKKKITEKNLIKKGIIENANKSAEVFIKEIFINNGFKKVNIVFK